ncbi:MAG: aminotransferase class I/II-fold pyridoxal phosphate-dependent enzyme [Clostridiaceae bacterium]
MRLSNKRYKDQIPGGLYRIGMIAKKLERDGHKLIHMEIGQPDFDSPKAAKLGAMNALNEGKVGYTSVRGIYPLRQAISEKEALKGLHYNPRDEIIITSGASDALASAFITMLEPGEEVLCFSPYYADYPEIIRLSGAIIKEVPLILKDEWVLDMDLFEDSVSENTKMILINTPNNPCGYNLTEATLIKIAEIAEKYSLPVISDECYDELIYSGEHTSIATLPGMRERTLVIKSMSKSYSMTGWRIGYAMGPKELINNVTSGHYAIATSAVNFAQWGALEAVRHGASFTVDLVSEFKKRSEYMYEKLKEVPGIKIAKPQGSMFLFPDVSAFGMEDFELCTYLMEEAGVVTAPGSIFGKAGTGHIRIACCVPFEDIVTATDALANTFSKLKIVD